MKLSFEADLTITGDDSTLRVTADDDGALVVTTGELRPVVAALRTDGLVPSGTLRTVSDGLAEAGATVHLRTPSTPLITLGAGASPGLVTRAAGLHHVGIRSVRGLVVALRPPVRPIVPAAAAIGVVVSVALRRRSRR